MTWYARPRAAARSGKPARNTLRLIILSAAVLSGPFAPPLRTELTVNSAKELRVNFARNLALRTTRSV